jgi:Putative peptidoglycan binding domain
MPTTISVLTGDMTCVSRLSGADGGASVVIKAAVGNAAPPRCQNFPDDVRTIQAALNRFTPLEGGPEPRLDEDGLCGPKTRKAISHFQEKWDLKPKNSKVPDGIGDPEGPTIQRLRKGSGAISNLPAEFLGRIPRVIGVTTAARSALTLAKSFLQRGNAPLPPQRLPSLGLLGQAEAQKVDRHFHINKSTRRRTRSLGWFRSRPCS